MTADQEPIWISSLHFWCAHAFHAFSSRFQSNKHSGKYIDATSSGKTQLTQVADTTYSLQLKTNTSVPTSDDEYDMTQFELTKVQSDEVQSHELNA